MSYQWIRDELPLPGETTPLFYAEKNGIYECRISLSGSKHDVVKRFSVTGNLERLRVPRNVLDLILLLLRNT